MGLESAAVVDRGLDDGSTFQRGIVSESVSVSGRLSALETGAGQEVWLDQHASEYKSHARASEIEIAKATVRRRRFLKSKSQQEISI
jgi:hypothetical protein